MTHDTMGYGICLNALGPEPANPMNISAVRLMAASEIKRIINLMGKPKDAMIHNFDELAEILECAPSYEAEVHRLFIVPDWIM